jgi:hypothetical protein
MDDIIVDSLGVDDFIFLRDLINNTKVGMGDTQDYIKLFEMREKLDNIIDMCE